VSAHACVRVRVGACMCVHDGVCAFLCLYVCVSVVFVCVCVCICVYE